MVTTDVQDLSPNSIYKIRRYQPCDNEQVKELFVVGMKEHNVDDYLHPDHHAAYLKRSLASDLSNIEETYFVEKGNFWVVVDTESLTEKIIGMVACEPKGDDVCELRRMSVHKDYRGKKIASMLMDCFLRHARDCGFQKVILGCWPHQWTAIAMYQKYGFKWIEERVVGFHGVKVADFELVL